jgi:hypothetical protein
MLGGQEMSKSKNKVDLLLKSLNNTAVFMESALDSLDSLTELTESINVLMASAREEGFNSGLVEGFRMGRSFSDSEKDLEVPYWTEKDLLKVVEKLPLSVKELTDKLSEYLGIMINEYDVQQALIKLNEFVVTNDNKKWSLANE